LKATYWRLVKNKMHFEPVSFTTVTLASFLSTIGNNCGGDISCDFSVVGGCEGDFLGCKSTSPQKVAIFDMHLDSSSAFLEKAVTHIYV
jgi:hypothetical protein